MTTDTKIPPKETYDGLPMCLLMCFACHVRKAKWLTAWGRLCGYCRRHYQSEMAKQLRREKRRRYET